MPIFINAPGHSLSIECNYCANYLDFDLDTEVIEAKKSAVLDGWLVSGNTYKCPTCLAENKRKEVNTIF